MIKTVTTGAFYDAFHDCNRGDNFTYAGLNALHEYLEMLEEDMGEQIELDVIALCCEFTEYEDMKELKGVYWDIKSMEELEENTIVIPVDGGGFIIQDF